MKSTSQATRPRAVTGPELFDSGSIWRILARIAPPVMFSQLILSLYNIVDSYFVGQYTADGLTALSVVYPIQIVITALAVGTGVGVNTHMARMYAQHRDDEADKTAGAGLFLSLITWVIFAAFSALIMRPFVEASAESPAAVEYGVTYGLIVCVGSVGTFAESIFTKVHQAQGNMKLPMAAQVAGAVTNVVLDPILIFGLGGIPAMGVAGAAWATVAGQVVSAVITGVRGFRRIPPLRDIIYYAKPIYALGYPSIFMQLMYTIYIMVLNFILTGFSDAAVTVLGLYYKMQGFFFIPLNGLGTCIVPLLSFQYARGNFQNCRKIFFDTVVIAMAFMLIGVACFEFIPTALLGIFADDAEVLRIGETAFRIIGLSFIPAVVSLTMPVFFQAIGRALPSVLLSVTRQMLGLIPLFWLFSLIGLDYTWMAFPCAEIITAAVGSVLYRRQVKGWQTGETQ